MSVPSGAWCPLSEPCVCRENAHSARGHRDAGADAETDPGLDGGAVRRVLGGPESASVSGGLVPGSQEWDLLSDPGPALGRVRLRVRTRGAGGFAASLLQSPAAVGWWGVLPSGGLGLRSHGAERAQGSGQPGRSPPRLSLSSPVSSRKGRRLHSVSPLSPWEVREGSERGQEPSSCPRRPVCSRGAQHLHAPCCRPASPALSPGRWQPVLGLQAASVPCALSSLIY